MIRKEFAANIFNHSQDVLYNHEGEPFVFWNEQYRRLYVVHGTRLTIIKIENLPDNPIVIVKKNVKVDPATFENAEKIIYPDTSRERIYVRFDRELGFIFGVPESASIIKFPESIDYKVSFDRIS